MCASLDMEARNGNMATDLVLHPHMDPALGGSRNHNLSGSVIDAVAAAQFVVANNLVLHQSFAPIGSFDGGFSENYGWNNPTIAPPQLMDLQGTSESQLSDIGESQAMPHVETALPVGPAQPVKKSRKTSKISAASKTSGGQANNGSSPAKPRKQSKAAKKRNDSIKLGLNEAMGDSDFEKYFSDDGGGGGGAYNLPTGSKRNMLLQRNRVSTSKCRQRKKKWVNGLEETKLNLEMQHSNLQSEYKELLGEVNQLKNELITHAGCQDSNINEWIGSAAQRFVDKTSLTSDGSQAGGSVAQGGKRQSGGSGSGLNYDSRPASTQHHVCPGSSPGALSYPIMFEDVKYDHIPDVLFDEVVSPGEPDNRQQ